MAQLVNDVLKSCIYFAGKHPLRNHMIQPQCAIFGMNKYTKKTRKGTRFGRVDINYIGINTQNTWVFLMNFEYLPG